MKSITRIFTILVCSFILNGSLNKVRSQDSTEWTIMVFMNGDNDLESYALIDFIEMSNVSFSNKVKIVVQLDRIGAAEDTTGTDWSQTIRFEMRQNIYPLPYFKIPGGDLGEQDMGNGTVLANFVDWAQKNYPAKRYMLVIWDHGQGWRFMQTLASDGVSPLINKEYYQDRSATHPAFKSVSHDETDSSELYNREIQDDLTLLLKGKKIDLLGFDACLMSMAETGYAFRGIAKYMVASEELEPGDGWNYSEWLTRLMKKPTMNEAELANEVVASYKKTYITRNPTTTLSAINLSQMENVATQIDLLAGLLISELPTKWAEIKKMRDGCNRYAPKADNPFYHIDIVQFCKQIISLSTNQQLVQQAIVTSDAITKLAVKANYFGKDRGGAYGSYGLAIYFPSTGNEYKNDVWEQDGYKKDNNNYPVEFVQKKRWADFLHAYFAKIP